MKPRLVMIPALCCNADLYASTRAALADIADISIVMPARSTFADCAADVAAAVDGPFIAMGTSFGGHIARELALIYPERVTGLWIIGSGAGAVADPVAGRARAAALREGRHEDVYRQFAGMISHLPGPKGPETRDAFITMAAHNDPQASARQADALAARGDRWGDLPRIACPALLLWGAYDKFSPASDGLRMAGLIPRARYVVIADCGHLPTLEAPEETEAAARHWLLDNFS